MRSTEKYFEVLCIFLNSQVRFIENYFEVLCRNFSEVRVYFHNVQVKVV